MSASRALRRGARGGRGRRRRRRALRPRARGAARERGRARRALAPRHPARGGDGRAAFRHALSWEAFYADVPWLRRRALHRQLAEALEAGGGQAMEVATHWLGARDAAARPRGAGARREESEAVHAYRDARAAGRQALELWPGDEEPAGGSRRWSATRAAPSWAGELAEAVKAWRELSASRSARGERLAFATPSAGSPPCYELKGERERRSPRGGSRPTRSPPPSGPPTPRSSGSRWPTTAASAPTTARRSSSRAPPPPRPTRAGRDDLRARALGLEGVARAKRGEFDGGARDGPRRARRSRSRGDLTAVAAELYQRLALVLYDSADYRRAEEALDTALGLCRIDGDESTEVACVTCLVYVLRERGEWARDERDVPRADRRRQRRLGRRRGCSARSTASRASSAPRGGCWSPRSPPPSRSATTTCRSTRSRPRLRRGGRGRARRGGRARRASCSSAGRTREDRHFAVWGLHWASGYMAGRGDRAGAHACAEALSRIASTTGHAVRAGRARPRDRRDRAARRRQRRPPPSSSPAPWRSTAASTSRSSAPSSSCARASRWPPPATARPRSSASAAPTAPRASSAPARWRPRRATEVSELGGSVSRRVSEETGLTRRELEVVRLIAVGRTNRESRRSCSSARARSTCTSATSCASSTATRAWRPPTARTSSGCSPRPPSARPRSRARRGGRAGLRAAPRCGGSGRA